MLGQTIRLIIKALIIGVLINLGIQHASTTPLPYSENSALHKQGPEKTPFDTKFHPTGRVEK
jgi:hypothetical protein